MNNFTQNEDDEGECWFDDSDAESKMIEFLITKLNDGELPITPLTDNVGLKFLDLGTGNGHLLYQLYQEFDEELHHDLNYTLKGIDYSPDSIQFATTLNSKHQLSNISFDQVDLLLPNSEFITNYNESFDILLDKGTFDAIALNQDKLAAWDNKIGMEIYPLQVVKLMHSGSIILITSCNFTEEELIKIMTSSGLKVWDKINYPTFEFGGVKGSTICSIAFIKD